MRTILLMLMVLFALPAMAQTHEAVGSEREWIGYITLVQEDKAQADGAARVLQAAGFDEVTAARIAAHARAAVAEHEAEGQAALKERCDNIETLARDPNALADSFDRAQAKEAELVEKWTSKPIEGVSASDRQRFQEWLGTSRVTVLDNPIADEIRVGKYDVSLLCEGVPQ